MKRPLEEVCVDALESFYLASLVTHGINRLTLETIDLFKESLEETSDNIRLFICGYALGLDYSIEELDKCLTATPSRAYEQLVKRYKES